MNKNNPSPSVSNRHPLHSTTIFAAMTFISRVFGYMRDAVIMIIFGAGANTDAFLVAFRLPNFLRRLFAEGAFIQAFVPVFSEYKTKHSAASMRDMLDHTAGSLALAVFLISILGIVLAPILVLIFAPGFLGDALRTELSTQMLRLTAPYIFFISLTAMAGAVLNTYGRFGIPALTPVLLNLSLIAAALWLAPRMSEPIIALAWGVLFAGVAQLLLQLAALLGLGIIPRPRVHFHHHAVRRIIRLMGPAVLSTSVVQINLLVDTMIASFLVAGSISWLYISDRFIELPVGLFGVALATVLLPRLSRCYASHQQQHWHATLAWGVGMEWLIGLPCAVGLLVLAEPILISLINYQAFTFTDVQMAALSMMAFALGVPAFMLVKVLNAGFFSCQDTATPARTAVIAMIANLVFNLLIVAVWVQQDYVGAHAGLALATSLSVWLNTGLLYRYSRRQRGFKLSKEIKGALIQSTIAAAVMGGTLVWLRPTAAQWLNWATGQRLMSLASLIVVGVAVYLLSLLLSGFNWRLLIKLPRPDTLHQ